MSGSGPAGAASTSGQAVAQAGAPEPVRQVDCAIVGGGPGGLSAAVCLARMRRSVLVIDDRDGRSLWGQTNRNYLGFPNGISAAEIRLAGRRQAARYGTRFLSGRVAAAGRALPKWQSLLLNPAHRPPLVSRARRLHESLPGPGRSLRNNHVHA